MAEKAPFYGTLLDAGSRRKCLFFAKYSDGLSRCVMEWMNLDKRPNNFLDGLDCDVDNFK